MEKTEVKIKRTIIEGKSALFHFGIKIAFAKIRCIWDDESLRSVQYKNKLLLGYLKKNYKSILKKYSSLSEVEQPDTIKNMEPIWVFWWQGREKMPEIIRLCQMSKEKAAGTHPVILLSSENVKDYVDFPDYIWNQFDLGKIRIQHLSDMIRVHLLYKYGGLWLDASIFCSKELPEFIFNTPIYSLKGKPDFRYISNNRWTTFVIAGQKENILCKFLNEFFEEYCKKGKPFIDYFMFDCAIALAYENIAAVRGEIDQIAMNEGDCYWLNTALTELEGKELICQMKKESSVFYKIAWNRPWKPEQYRALKHYLSSQFKEEQ